MPLFERGGSGRLHAAPKAKAIMRLAPNANVETLSLPMACSVNWQFDYLMNLFYGDEGTKFSSISSIPFPIFPSCSHFTNKSIIYRLLVSKVLKERGPWAIFLEDFLPELIIQQILSIHVKFYLSWNV